MVSVTFNYADFQDGSIDPSGLYLSTSNLQIGAKASPFIAVVPNATYTFTFQYNLNTLISVPTTWAWGRVFTYDSNQQPLALAGVYNEVVSWNIFTITFKSTNEVKYFRFSASHIAHNAVSITINYDAPEPEPVIEKTILRLHANGNFEPIDTPLIQSQITNNYSFTNSSITVPTIVEYSTALEDMPAWVRDTGQPISFFPQGIVIKGRLIQSDT